MTKAEAARNERPSARKAMLGIPRHVHTSLRVHYPTCATAVRQAPDRAVRRSSWLQGLQALPDLLPDLPDALHVRVSAAFRLPVEQHLTAGGDLQTTLRGRYQRHRSVLPELVPDLGRHPGGQREVPSGSAVPDLDGQLAGIRVLHRLPPSPEQPLLPRAGLYWDYTFVVGARRGGAGCAPWRAPDRRGRGPPARNPLPPNVTPRPPREEQGGRPV